MNYLSICSGIEAATVAWQPLGWRAVALSEIEKFPRAVLAHHYPGVPLRGDVVEHEYGYRAQYARIDRLVMFLPGMLRSFRTWLKSEYER